MNGNRCESDVNPVLGELRELSREPDWRAMEERLLDAPDDRTGTQPAPYSRPRTRWRWTAAAATVFLAAAITFYLPSSRYGTVLPKPDSAQPSTLPLRSDEASKPAAPNPTTNTPGRVTPPAAPIFPRGPLRTKPAAAAPSTLPASRPATTSTFDFVALPGAFALPELESGRIVRMEVPLTMLPAYGLDLVPDATPVAVQAEFLIGQDGVPRAIRLASTSARDQRP